LAFRPMRARSTLLRRGTTAGPVRAHGLLPRSTLHLVRPCGFPRTQCQDASKSLLQPTFTSRAPVRRHHLRRLPAERRGKPADVRPRDRPGQRVSATLHRAAPDHLAVIRPPTAPRLTARRRLRAGWHSPRIAPERGRGRESAAALSAACGSAEPDPLAPLTATGDAQSAPMPSRGPVLPGARQCGRAFGARGAFHRARPRRTPFRARPGALFPAGRRGSRRTCSSVFGNTD